MNFSELKSYKTLARAISLVENKAAGYESILLGLPHISSNNIVGITGPPGAGKSTIVDALIKEMTDAGKTVGVLCVDPSSPFNFGALLGDRIRMSQWYNHPNVFIRSLATRGSLGGLHPSIIEISGVMQAAGFDYVVVETVGVGQSEVEIAGLADTTVIVLVPEAGDEVQNMKAGLMEIGDIFVVNKADRPDAETFVRNLKRIVAPHPGANATPVIKTIASQHVAIDELFEAIQQQSHLSHTSEKKYRLLAQKAYELIQQKRMKDIDKEALFQKIKGDVESGKEFNLFAFAETLQ